ncbi:MAG: hypothetical protein HYU37_08055 [Acidobacteria bacterium]|nr:hypothetical protein [Acidobacteriota bacterium]
MQRAIRLAVFVVSAAVVSSDGSAEQTTAQSSGAPEQISTEQTEDSVRVRATVVVTATRSDAELDKTPLSASVITRQDLESRPLQNVDQQLTLTEGVYVQRFQGFSATDSNVNS